MPMGGVPKELDPRLRGDERGRMLGVGGRSAWYALYSAAYQVSIRGPVSDVFSGCSTVSQCATQVSGR